MSDATPSPEQIFRIFIGYQRTAALVAAVELDLFTAIGEGVATTSALAARAGAAERGVRSLCDALVVMELLTKEGDRYALGPTAAAFLDRHSPAFLGSIGRFLTTPTITEAFARLTAAVRKGGTAVDEEGTLAAEHPVWVDFARAMAPLAAMSAELLAALLEAQAGARWRVLDLAAGHGLFGITIARHDPNATVVALDWPNVLAVARENAVAAGVADRFRVIEGSALTTDWGGGYHLVLFTNFLHHFDPATCERLLATAHAALAAGGRAVLVEFVPDEGRVTPPDAAMFSLTMLATTPSGDAYTFAEYERMLRRAGFARAEMHPLLPSPQQVIVAHR